MAKRTYDIRVGGEVFRLRLTIGGQRALRERFNEEILETIVTAAVDGEYMAALLEQALNWEGNQNTINSGELFYDHLVDAGWSGQEDFGALAFEIAQHSGLISRGQAEQLKRSLKTMVADAFDHLNAQTPDEERPMAQP